VKVCLISDTHELHDKVDPPTADLLIHAGDFTQRGEMMAIIKFNNWLGEQKHKYKYGIVVVAGNHERKLDPENKDYLPGLERLITNATLLNEQLITINGYDIYGSPYTPEYGSSWAYVYDRAEGFKHWDKIPENVDILITHGPPQDILDKVHGSGTGCGCYDLKRATKRVRPKLHVFGHIHGSYGKLRSQDILYVNAALCGEPKWSGSTRGYEIKNKPVIVELPSRMQISAVRLMNRIIAWLEKQRDRVIKDE
jgi:Icc-related predicted phosphoesterase